MLHPENPAYVDGGPGGMTIRAEIAQRVLTAFLQNPNVVQANDYNGWSVANSTPKLLAEFCVAHADALIEALNAEPAPQTKEGT